MTTFGAGGQAMGEGGESATGTPGPGGAFAQGGEGGNSVTGGRDGTSDTDANGGTDLPATSSGSRRDASCACRAGSAPTGVVSCTGLLASFGLLLLSRRHA